MYGGADSVKLADADASHLLLLSCLLPVLRMQVVGCILLFRTAPLHIGPPWATLLHAQGAHSWLSVGSCQLWKLLAMLHFILFPLCLVTSSPPTLGSVSNPLLHTAFRVPFLFLPTLLSSLCSSSFFNCYFCVGRGCFALYPCCQCPHSSSDFDLTAPASSPWAISFSLCKQDHRNSTGSSDLHPCACTLQRRLEYLIPTVKLPAAFFCSL